MIGWRAWREGREVSPERIAHLPGTRGPGGSRARCRERVLSSFLRPPVTWAG